MISVLRSIQPPAHPIFMEANGILLSLAEMCIHCLYGDLHGSCHEFPHLPPRKERTETLAGNSVPWIVLFFLTVSLSVVNGFWEQVKTILEAAKSILGDKGTIWCTEVVICLWSKRIDEAFKGIWQTWKDYIPKNCFNINVYLFYQLKKICGLFRGWTL